MPKHFFFFIIFLNNLPAFWPIVAVGLNTNRWNKLFNISGTKKRGVEFHHSKFS